MFEMLKKTLFAGVGATVVTAERVEAALNDLVEKGRISADEARETAAKIADDSKKEYEEARSSLQNLFDEMLERANVATHRDLKRLETRLTAVEAKLAETQSEPESKAD